MKCFPALGIVIKTPIACLGDFGVKANKAEIALWERTHHPLLAPVSPTPSGNVAMPYYMREPRDIVADVLDTTPVTDKRLKAFLRNREVCFHKLVDRILGVEIESLFGEGHDASIRNFRLTEEGKLVMVDYGISYPEHQEKFVEFLGKYGQKLVDEYQEPPIN